MQKKYTVVAVRRSDVDAAFDWCSTMGFAHCGDGKFVPHKGGFYFNWDTRECPLVILGNFKLINIDEKFIVEFKLRFG